MCGIVSYCSASANTQDKQQLIYEGKPQEVYIHVCSEQPLVDHNRTLQVCLADVIKQACNISSLKMHEFRHSEVLNVP